MTVSSLNSNVFSLKVQRSLGSATERVVSAFEKLSTGLRINKASDDAAGLAIADSLRVNARLQTTAIRNVNDGISALNIIGGTLNDQTSIITRLLELAEQSANGTFSSSQRRSLSDEYHALVQEFGRLGATTSFNGINLLLGGRGSNISNFGLQAGITGESVSQIGVALSDTGRLSGTIDWDQLSSITPSGTMTHEALAAGYNGQLIRATVSDNLGTSHEVILAPYQSIVGAATVTVRYFMFARSSDAASGGGASADSWTSLSSGVAPTMIFDRATGEYNTGSSTSFSGFTNGGSIQSSQFDFSALELASSGEAHGQVYNPGIVTSIDLTGVESQTHARLSLVTLRNRLDELNNIKGVFGAVQSRLGISKDLLAGSRENTQAAESRIRDVDIAEETASLVAAQITQQTASSVLKLANAQPQLLISLITDAGGKK